MAEQYKSLHPIKYYRDYLSQNLRPDGRELTEHRPILVNLGSISTADGSAIAKIGRTTVVCGIKAELCQPKAATPREGFLIVDVDLPPLCSSKFRPGPPSDQAQVYTQLLNDIVANARCLDLRDLCIHPDKLAWCLYADLICLDFDGAVVDACVLALVAALRSLTLPTVEYDAALANKQVNLEERKPLRLVGGTPVSTTFAVFDDKILLTDPTVEEENLCTGVLTITMCGDNAVSSVHKPGGSPLDDEQLFGCIEKCKGRVAVVNEIIETALTTS